MERFNLPQRLVILDNGNPLTDTIVNKARMQNILSFSVIVEALLQGRLRRDDGVLIVDNDIPSSCEMVEKVVGAIGSSPALRSIKQWTDELCVQIPFYLHIRGYLLKEGILQKEKKKILGFPYRGRYLLNDQRLVTRYLKHLEQNMDPEHPDIRDLLILIFISNTRLREISFVSIDVDEYLKKIHLGDDTLKEVIQIAKHI
ncbi:MAG: hypothetical protein R6U19_07040 [Bacteroidales bacterium]